MSLRNRVDPCGAIFRSPARGTFMGNRGGALHDEAREIVRQCKGHRWITCLLEFKGRRRSVMSLGRYTELFFLDEAVSLAAGHRPCAECRRDRFNVFKTTWKRWSGLDPGHPLLAPEMDAELHGKRIDPQGRKVTYEASLDSLPDGCFIRINGSSYLLWKDALLLWSPEGYVKKRHRAGGSKVTVLTPEPLVQCIREGYVPKVHESSLAF
jgi:hypothetical protein